MGRNVPKRWAQGDLSAAQDEAADAQTEAIVARVSATVAAALRAELVELRSWSQEVPELVARTEKLEQFVEGLKPDGKDPVVRRAEYDHALGVMEKKNNDGGKGNCARYVRCAFGKVHPAPSGIRS